MRVSSEAHCRHVGQCETLRGVDVKNSCRTWRASGSTAVHNNFVRLTPDRQSKKGDKTALYTSKWVFFLLLFFFRRFVPYVRRTARASGRCVGFECEKKTARRASRGGELRPFCHAVLSRLSDSGAIWSTKSCGGRVGVRRPCAQRERAVFFSFK